MLVYKALLVSIYMYTKLYLNAPGLQGINGTSVTDDITGKLCNLLDGGLRSPGF